MLKFDFRPTRKYFSSYFKPTMLKALDTGFDNMGKALTEYSRWRHPTFKNRTGNLARSLRWNRKGLRGNVESDVVYSKFLYDGTKRHFIKPVNASALSWTQNGKRFFSKGHFVSGIKKSEWIKNNYEDRDDRFNQYVKRSVMRAFGD